MTACQETHPRSDLEEGGQLPWSQISPPKALSVMAEAYHHAEQRRGKKGTTFLEALCEGSTVEEASKKAGFSRQTGHKFLRELRKDLSPSDY